MTVYFRLADHGHSFSTRPRGAELRSELRDRLDGGDQLLTIDLAGVMSVSYSFADEFVGRLMSDWSEGDLPRAPHVVGASDDVQRIITRSLVRRGIEAPADFCAAQ